MPVSSYVIYPVPGREVSLADSLCALPQVEVFPDDQNKIFVVVTDTENFEQEKNIQEAIEAMDGVLCTAVTFVGNDSEGSLSKDNFSV